MSIHQEKRAGLPLAGVRVADFSWVISGPHCNRFLGSMGAEITKIESGRLAERAVERGMRVPPASRAGAFHVLNNSKLSVTLNLTHPKAQELARQIIMVSDVVIENFAAGVMDRMGLGYESLSKMKPDLILVAASGLGRTGPDRDYTAYGRPIHSFSGLTGLTGYEDGPPGWGATTLTDPMTGVLLVYSILAALYHREKTGEGQYIDVSMGEATIVRIPEAIMDYTMNGRVRAPSGNFDDIMAPHGCYPTNKEDNWIAITVESEEQWDAFCGIMGKTDLAKDPRFVDAAHRIENRKQLDTLVADWTQGQDREQLFKVLQKSGISSGPAYPVDDMVNDPQIQERGLFFDLEHPGGEGIGRVTRLPWLLSPNPAVHQYATPAMGEDSRYVLEEVLGLPQDEVQRLVEEKVVF